MKRNRVKFNVGGKKFETTATTLATAGPDSFFGPLLSDNWNVDTDEVFIDRDPDCFSVILNLLRTGELHLPPHVRRDLLWKEAEFYGVLDLVRSASWGPLNGNMLELSCSIKCRGESKATIIRGSPNGGFCVARENNLVHVYDSMQREHPPVNLDYKAVNDVMWVNSTNIAISTTESMGLFNAATGELVHKFCDEDGNQVKGAKTMCLSDSYIFYTCSCRCYFDDHNTIRTLDRESGKSIILPNLRNCLSHCMNLHMLHDSKTLIATYYDEQCDPSTEITVYNFKLRIIDLRDKSPARQWPSNNVVVRGVEAATVLEDRNLICLVYSNGHFDFRDLRLLGNNVRTRRGRPKVVYHNEKLFVSFGSCISVHSGPEWIQTSELLSNRDGGGSIHDFSISGDGLFALHGSKNLVDVWQTPPPPSITIL